MHHPEPEVLDGSARRDDSDATAAYARGSRSDLCGAAPSAAPTPRPASTWTIDPTVVATEYGNIGEELWKFSN